MLDLMSLKYRSYNHSVTDLTSFFKPWILLSFGYDTLLISNLMFYYFGYDILLIRMSEFCALDIRFFFLFFVNFRFTFFRYQILYHF